MNPRLLIGSVLLAVAADGFAATAADLSWLAGCWASTDSELGSGEQWTAPAGGTLLGMARRIHDGRTVSYEWMRIIETGKDSLAYIALPSGQAETRFELVELGDRQVRFDNSDHDFPQRVVYRRDGDRLQARIAGQVDGRERAVEFPMQRVACAGDE